MYESVGTADKVEEVTDTIFSPFSLLQIIDKLWTDHRKYRLVRRN